MSRETLPVTGVSNHFGPRETGGAIGTVKTEGSKNEFAVKLTGEVLDNLIVSPVDIPANSIITKAYIHVTEAFDLAAVSVVEVGTEGSEATNGVSLLEADLESTGYVDVTAQLAGTWDAEVPLAADTRVAIAFSAGSVTDSTVGVATLVVEYTKVV